MKAIAMTGCLACASLASTGALAHARIGESTQWTFDAWIVAPLVLAAVLFALGAARILRRTRARAVHARRIVVFALGWASLVGALVSPLHALGERSFAAHMLEHEILMLVAAPLLVMAQPLAFFAWALPPDVRRASGRIERNRAFARAWQWLTAPVPATVLQAIALWAWHVPVLFDRAVEHDGWHTAQHASFLVTALLFWTAMLDRHRRLRHPATIIGCLFVTALVSGALGALMALSWSPWYAAYARLGMTPLGLSPVEDQQLAGLLMWIPGGLVHAGAALALVVGVLRAATNVASRQA